MQYCNVKMPLEMAYMDTDKDVRDLLGALVGPVDEWADASIDKWVDASPGSSPYGAYEEGEVVYKLDGKRWLLTYDFFDVGNGVARVFRYTIDRWQPEWDNDVRRRWRYWYSEHWGKE